MNNSHMNNENIQFNKHIIIYVINYFAICKGKFILTSSIDLYQTSFDTRDYFFFFYFIIEELMSLCRAK